MANVKISSLPQFSDASGLDKVPVVDVSAGDTKAYTIEQLLSGNYSIAGTKTYTGSATWSNSDYLGIPIGTTAQRPAVPQNGMIRYNSDLSEYEFYNNGNWDSIGGTSPVASTVTLTPDNTTNATRYPLFVDSATGNESPRTDTGFTYNPSTGNLTSTYFTANGTGAITVTVGTEAQRPSPTIGMLRFNSTYSQFEGYNGTAWSGLGGATGGAGSSAFYENDISIAASYTITPGKNAITAGPITIEDGVVVTIPDGSTWTVV